MSSSSKPVLEPGSPMGVPTGVVMDLAVLKSWDFGSWARQHGGQLPYRMDYLQSRGIHLRWTDRLHDERWQQSPAASMLRRAEAAAVPFAQSVLLGPSIRRCSATLAMFESEANFLAAARHATVPSKRRPFLVLSCWLAHVLSKSSEARRAGYRWAYRTVDVLYFFSKNQGPLLQEMLRLPEDRLRYLPFGVDTEAFAPLGEPDGGYLLAVGRDRARDWSTFFEAVNGLDMPVKVCCRPSQIAGMSIPSNVEVLGYVDRDRYRLLLGRASVVAVLTHPVEYPSGQSVLLEARAMGRTVVVTSTASLTEYLEDGVDCLVVPPNDAAAARQRIEQAAGDDGLRARIGQSARQVAESTYSSKLMWDSVADDLFRLTGRS